MKALKIAGIVILAWIGIVVLFESLIGIIQPMGEPAIVLTTFDADGTAHDRVVSRLESGGNVYVAANHWPRAWYERALRNPEVQVTRGGETRDYRAEPVTGAEHDRVNADNSLGPVMRVLTGFPPRRFVRLDPR